MTRYKQVSGIWIPEDTDLSDHPAKTRNFAKLKTVDGFTRVDIVGIPVLKADTLEGRVKEAKAFIGAAFSQEEIGLNPNDFMVRSALVFEDTVEHRAAGIGSSRRFKDPDLLEHVLLYDILAVEDDGDVSGYVAAHNLSFGLGLQLCNTQLDPLSEFDHPEYSGSVKLIAPDLIEVVVNFGFSFLKDGRRNKAHNFRVIVEKKDGSWSDKFLRKGYRFDSTYQIPLTIVQKLVNYAQFLANQKDFPEGLDFEYVVAKTPEIIVVQYAPIPFMTETSSSDQKFEFGNDPSQEYSFIIGDFEGYFPPEKVFLLQSSAGAAAQRLAQFNDSNDGYVIIDRLGSSGMMLESCYGLTSNARGIIDYGGHTQPLADHLANIAREEGKFIAAPNKWQGSTDSSDSLYMRHLISFTKEGVSIQVSERNQTCKLAVGNIFE